jgi:glucokinase
VTEVVVAVDIGGTTLRAGLVDAAGAVLWAVEEATVNTACGRDPGLRQLASLVDRLRVEADKQGHTVRAISFGFPEYVTGDRLTSCEVIAWDRQPAEMFGQSADGVPVFVESDVRCAALAEAATAPAGEGGLFYVSWGTGLSSTLVVDGACLAGRRGEAIALGELDVPAVVDADWTANLEQFASGGGIARRYAASHPSAEVDGRTVAGLAEAGDPDSMAIVDSAARAVAAALRSCVAILDPDVVVLGGGIGSADGLLVATLRAELDRLLLPRPDPPPVRTAVLGARAGLIGAGLVGWRRLA